MQAIQAVPNIFAAFLFIIPIAATLIRGEFTATQTSFITMLLVCVLGFIYCMNTTVFSKDEYEDTP